jgi:polar amino acid transport system substrate-binding protein
MRGGDCAGPPTSGRGASTVLRRSVLAAAAASVTAGCQPRAAAGVARVASTATGVPFSFIDPQTNALTGALVDIMTTVASAAALPIELETLPFAALIPALTARKIDVIAAAMFKTLARERVVAFTDPVYAYGGGVVLTSNDSHSVHRLEDLRGRRVGAQVGSVFVGQLKDADVDDVATYDNLSDALRDLGHARVQAVYGDAPILTYQLRVYARPNLTMATSFRPSSAQEVCFVLRKGDPLVLRLNQAIAKVRAGPLDGILRTWALPQAA